MPLKRTVVSAPAAIATRAAHSDPRVFVARSVKPLPQVQDGSPGSRRRRGGSTAHCSRGGASGAWKGTTTSVAVTVPLTPSITLKARLKVEATIELKVWVV